jgi:hypothetical protein
MDAGIIARVSSIRNHHKNGNLSGMIIHGLDFVLYLHSVVLIEIHTGKYTVHREVPELLLEFFILSASKEVVCDEELEAGFQSINQVGWRTFHVLHFNVGSLLSILRCPSDLLAKLLPPDDLS